MKTIVVRLDIEIFELLLRILSNFENISCVYNREREGNGKTM